MNSRFPGVNLKPLLISIYQKKTEEPFWKYLFDIVLLRKYNNRKNFRVILKL